MGNIELKLFHNRPKQSYRASDLHKKGEKGSSFCGPDTNSAQRKLPTSHLTNQRRDDFEADNFQNLH